jgi:2'-5' RNA ligase
MSCVLTLAVDEASQERFEALRRRYFPAERNVIPAHVTLFHTLPEDDATVAALESVAAQSETFPLQVVGARSMGRGVMLQMDGGQDALRLHRLLRLAFDAVLTAQDLQGFRPHVVIQNKVTPELALATLAKVQAGFAPWTCVAVGLDLWRYLGGPWEHLQRFEFGGAALDV